VGEAAGAGDVFGAVVFCEDVFERPGAAVVEQADAAIDADERGGVVALVMVVGRAEANVVDLAVGEVRSVVALDAAGSVALEDLSSALGRLGERAISLAE